MLKADWSLLNISLTVFYYCIQMHKCTIVFKCTKFLSLPSSKIVLKADCSGVRHIVCYTMACIQMALRFYRCLRTELNSKQLQLLVLRVSFPKCIRRKNKKLCQFKHQIIIKKYVIFLHHWVKNSLPKRMKPRSLNLVQ